MPFRLDHLVITVDALDAAVNQYQALGFTVTPGGVHASGATENALIYFQDRSYLELLALTGQPARTDVDAPDYTPLFQGRTGLIGYCLLSNDLDADVLALRTRGIEVSDPRPGGRTRPDGAVLMWKTASIGSSLSPFFIEDVSARPLRVPDKPEYTSHANGAAGIVTLNFAVANIDAAAKRYAQILGHSSETVYDQRAAVFQLDAHTQLILNPLEGETAPITPDAPVSYTVETTQTDFQTSLPPHERPHSLLLRHKAQ
jgi:hypothetical protein